MSSITNKLLPSKFYGLISLWIEILPEDYNPEYDLILRNSMVQGNFIFFTKSEKNMNAPLRTHITTKSRVSSSFLIVS